MKTIFTAAEQCLNACDVEEKLRLSKAAAQTWRDDALLLTSDSEPAPIGEAGRPARPLLVKPSDVARRGLGSEKGRVALIHSLAHIEFNAINLAWDAVYRYRDMPRQFYTDWVRVADEEAYHFTLLRDRLRELDSEYGDLPAHNGLWDMAQKTAFDPMVRMALVPRVLEARGLDVTPEIMNRLEQVGDDKTAAILRIILRDEVGHVAIGSRWYKYHCDKRGLDSENTFRDLILQYFNGQVRGPFNYKERKQAGFSDAELQQLEHLGVST